MSLIKLLAKSPRFYETAGACLAALDGTQVFALIRDRVCNDSNGRLKPQDIDHVVVVLTDKNRKAKMLFAECTTRPMHTQWCTDPEHMKEIASAAVRLMDKHLPQDGVVPDREGGQPHTLPAGGWRRFAAGAKRRGRG